MKMCFRESEKTEHKLALDICNICKQQNINFQTYNPYRTINKQVNRIEKVFTHEHMFCKKSNTNDWKRCEDVLNFINNRKGTNQDNYEILF